jgi:hypothetical protein
VVKEESRQEAIQRLAVLTGLCVVGAACNVLLPLLFWNRVYESFWWYLALFASGALVSEVCLLGIWCGLSLQALKYRLPITVSLVVIAACTYSLGLQLPDDGMPLVVALLIGTAAFGMFLALQLPLWLMRCCSPRRIASPALAARGRPSRESQFSVGYLMLWMALVGLLLVVVRNSLPDTNENIPQRELGGILLVILAYIGLSALLCVPCIWIVLGAKNARSAALLLVGLLLIAPWVMLHVGKAAFPPFRTSDLLVGTAIYSAGLTTTTLGVAIVWWMLGYRYISVPDITVPDSRLETESDAGSPFRE